MNISRNSTYIILDWDDTLFPTTWTTKNGLSFEQHNIERYSSYFHNLDDILYKLLLKLNDFGKVVIITNALPVWIDISSKVLRKTRELLRKMDIISAKKLYRNKFQNAVDWKKMAFREELKKYEHSVTNIISVGDAIYEYIALIKLYDSSANTKYLKSIKMIEKPNYEALIKQLYKLYENIPSICTINKHLDMKFTSGVQE